MIGFIEELKKTPTDWALRLIYADYLEEQGKLDEAATQRWMVKMKVAPRRYWCVLEGIRGKLPKEEVDCWNWWREDHNYGSDPNDRAYVIAMLPMKVFEALSDHHKSVVGGFAEYDNLWEAEQDLTAALKKVRLI